MAKKTTRTSKSKKTRKTSVRRASRTTGPVQSTDLLAKNLAASSNQSATPRVTQVRGFFAQQGNLRVALLVLVVLFGLYLIKDQFIVAIVNGRPIWRWTVIQKLENQGGYQAVDGLITETLVRQAIKESGVTIDQAEIDATLAEIEGWAAAQGITLDQALEQAGRTRAALIDDIVLSKSADQLVADQVSVTDEEVSEYIETNREYLPADMDEAVLREEVKAQLITNELETAKQAWAQGLRDTATIQFWREYTLNLQ